MSIAQIVQTFTGTGVGTFAPAGATFTKIKGTANLTLGGTSPVGTVKLEKSYDSGVSWFDVSVDALGTLASWTLAAATEISVLIDEPEVEVAYRCNCTAYTSGTITARISQ
jgi:hypothetical protein